MVGSFFFTKLCLFFQDLAVYEKEPDSVVKNTEKGKVNLICVSSQSVSCMTKISKNEANIQICLVCNLILSFY